MEPLAQPPATQEDESVTSRHSGPTPLYDGGDRLGRLTMPAGPSTAHRKNGNTIDSPRRVAPAVTVTAGMIRPVSERRRGIGGRPGKGDRELVGARVHPAKKKAIDDAAKDVDATRNDWLVLAIEVALKHPDLVVELMQQHPQLAFDQEVLGESA